jgi:hypothetical protein
MRAGSKDPEGEIAKLTRTYDWRTTDQDEIRLRQERAREEQPQIRNLDPAQRIFSQFEVVSRSGMTYSVELRSLAGRIFSCTCIDFRINGLGTCKHVEAVLLNLEARFPRIFTQAVQNDSDRLDVVWDETRRSLRLENPAPEIPPVLQEYFTSDGHLRKECDVEEAVLKLPRLGIPQLRVSQEVARSIEQGRRQAERIILRRDYEEKVQSGVYPQHETRVPLFPYQREGMLHLAFNERALLADEMGLGKTIQVVAACALLHRLGKAARVLVVTPASLKTEWEEQIQRFSGLPPGRTDRNFFVSLSHRQLAAYQDHQVEVLRLVHLAKRRPLTKKEQDKLMRELAMLRMTCDTTYILDREDRTSPKVEELQRILEECLMEAEVKVLLFSEWERMLELARDCLRQMRIGYAWHTGSVPQKRRRAEIRAFKSDPECRVFLSTDSGGVGLNLQNASVVINCDLPWNPAKLEQRIARAWRKNQTRPVTVINLIAENTIEHRMLGTLAAKRGLADGVLDRIGDLSEIKLKRGGQTFLSKLELMIAPSPPVPSKQAPLAATALPADPAEAFAQHAARLIGSQLLTCEERFPDGASSSVLVVVVDNDAATWGERLKPAYEKLLGNRRSGPPEDLRLEVIDRSTEDAIRRLCETGLLQVRIRATRHLHPKGDMAPVVLSEEERARIDSHWVRSKRKLKMGRILAAEELLDEARDAVGEAILSAARASAVQARLPEPESLKETILPPLVACWGESRSLIQRFLAESNHELGSIIQTLERSLPG